MAIHAVNESQASPELKNLYQTLKSSFDSPTLPVFFTYLGAFPQYLSYITEQLVDNLKHPDFIKLTDSVSRDYTQRIHEILKHGKNITDWLERYQNTPTFFNFQKDLQHIYLVNIKLAFVFVALREAVKGWAIAAKKLTATTDRFTKVEEEKITADDFVFSTDVLKDYQVTSLKGTQALDIRTTTITKSEPGALEKNLLPLYLELSNQEFKNHMKVDRFWALRVYLEDMTLLHLNHLPNLIYSPFNVIYKLTQHYDNFDDLIYILAEKFPTLAMQRMMFSGYILC